MILSLYDADGIVGEYIFDLIERMMPYVSEIHVVANGILKQKYADRLKTCVNSVSIRPNTGFDGGAYKYIIRQLGRYYISTFDSLILCNDTFYGPFVDLRELFERMDGTKADFWGLNIEADRGIFTCIQSYFLVFNKRVICEDVFYNYFRDRIDEENLNRGYDILDFEYGIFDVLSKNYSYATYAACEIEIFGFPGSAMEQFDLPVLKRKFFTETLYDEKQAQKALYYIRGKGYDISIILDDVKRKYNRQIDQTKICNTAIDDKEPKRYWKRIVCDINMLSKFGAGSYPIYIYGAGEYGRSIYHGWHSYFCNFQGFIVSDGQPKQSTFLGYPVKYLSEVEEEKFHSKIFVAMSQEHTEDMRDKLTGWKDVLFLFDRNRDGEK